MSKLGKMIIINIISIILDSSNFIYLIYNNYYLSYSSIYLLKYILNIIYLEEYKYRK